MIQSTRTHKHECGKLPRLCSRCRGLVLVGESEALASASEPQDDSCQRETHMARRRSRILKGNLKEQLVKRLVLKRTAGGPVYIVDLRHPGLGNHGRLRVRCRTSSQWPNAGPTTGDRATAEAWLEAYYVPWLQEEQNIRQAGAGRMTVEQAFEGYLKALEKGLRTPQHNTVINRRSAFTVHIRAAFEGIPLAALSKETVRRFLENLEVEKWEFGKKVRRPAEYRTRGNIRSALLAVWNHHYPGVPCPYSGIRLSRKSGNAALIIAQRTGVPTSIRKKTYTPDEIRSILVQAVLQDRAGILKPNVVVRVLPNTAAVIACLVGTGMRITELVYWRWSHIDLDRRRALVPGSKTLSAERLIPVQDQLVPWLLWLRRQQGEPRGDEFVIRTHPRIIRPAAQNTYQNRIKRVLDAASLKIPRKVTHIFRATHSTWGLVSKRVEEEFLEGC